jgi:histidyl-tRNA synthetase
MSKVPVSPPSGFRDFLPEEASARAKLIDSISRIYQSHGFQPIGMSMLENLSTLQGKGGGSDNEKLIFKVLKRGEELVRAVEKGEGELADLGLRFDLTLPLARYYSRFREQLPKPFKVFQIGPVWRADRPQKGRFREFFQCDVDIIGAKEIGAEADCISAILEVFSAAGLPGAEVHLNDRRLLSALGAKLGASAAAWAKCLVSLDKLDKLPAEKVREEMLQILAADGQSSADLGPFLDSGEMSDEWKVLDEQSYGDLQALSALLKQLHPGVAVKVNPTLVRGQDYYTGTIFEIRHPDLSGSLGGGGRYNRLLEIFGGAETPAFGGSIGFERLCLLLQEGGHGVGSAERPEVFLPLFDVSLRGPVLSLAAALRAEGIRADVYPDAAKLKNQFKYADDRGIPFTAVLGTDEWQSRSIKVKSMADRTEETVSLENFVKRMKELCKR